MKLEHQLSMNATPEQAWTVLMDVPRIVPCMPGAELVETVAENRWKALMRVKLGPMLLLFDVDLERTVVDEVNRRVELKAAARETRNRGRVKATIESVLSESDGSDVTVTMVTDLTLQGAVAQYGAGIVRDVSEELVRSFASSLQDLVQPVLAPSAAAVPPPSIEQPTLSARHLVASMFRTRLANFFESLANRLRERDSRK